MSDASEMFGAVKAVLDDPSATVGAKATWSYPSLVFGNMNGLHRLMIDDLGRIWKEVIDRPKASYEITCVCDLRTMSGGVRK